MGEKRQEALELQFDKRLRLEFHAPTIGSVHTWLPPTMSQLQKARQIDKWRNCGTLCVGPVSSLLFPVLFKPQPFLRPWMIRLQPGSN